MPHYHYTMEINASARAALLQVGGIVEQVRRCWCSCQGILGEAHSMLGNGGVPAGPLHTNTLPAHAFACTGDSFWGSLSGQRLTLLCYCYALAVPPSAAQHPSPAQALVKAVGCWGPDFHGRAAVHGVLCEDVRAVLEFCRAGPANGPQEQARFPLRLLRCLRPSQRCEHSKTEKIQPDQQTWVTSLARDCKQGRTSS